jgi:N-ethylmaleimide reductase
LLRVRILSILSSSQVGPIDLNDSAGLGAPTGTPAADPLDESNTIPNELMVEYYTQRATVGLLITEGTIVSEQGSGWLYAPHMRTKAHVEGWKQVTDAVRARNPNAVFYMQMWHLGRHCHSSFHPSTGTISSASAIAMPDGLATSASGEKVPYEVPVPMTHEQIQETIQDYARAALLAKEAGFDGVEVQCVGGYMIDSFLQSSTNQRTDEYGGSMENRVRLLEEIIQGIIDAGAFPPHRIGVRVNPNGNFGGVGSADNHIMFPFVAKTLNKYGLAYLHVMEGLGFGYHEKSPVVTVFDMKKEFDSAPIICGVGLTKDTAEGMIRSGAADLASFGRLLITNPDLPERISNDWPLADSPPFEAWWTPTGAKGYTDWPTYDPAQAEMPKERFPMKML